MTNLDEIATIGTAVAKSLDRAAVIASGDRFVADEAISFAAQEIASRERLANLSRSIEG